MLIVDDNDAMLTRAAAVLMPSCTIVDVAIDGRAALDAARTLHPDVIVLDISMPRLSGFEVAALLREAGCDAAVVFCTVHDDEDFVQAAKAAGGVGYVVKRRLASDLPLAVRAAGVHRRCALSLR